MSWSQNLKEDIELLKKLKKKSTRVVSWYSHPTEVRGPYNRWLTVSAVDEKYRKYVGTQADDAAYAATAMNLAPDLVERIEFLENEIKALTHEGRQGELEQANVGFAEEMQEFAAFRRSLRQILHDNGVKSNPGWSEENIIQEFRYVLNGYQNDFELIRLRDLVLDAVEAAVEGRRYEETWPKTWIANAKEVLALSGNWQEEEKEP